MRKKEPCFLNRRGKTLVSLGKRTPQTPLISSLGLGSSGPP